MLYNFPLIFNEAPLAAKSGDNSINMAQADLTLALYAFSAPPADPIVSPRYQNLLTHSHFPTLFISTSF